jgi:hypothetical protein
MISCRVCANALTASATRPGRADVESACRRERRIACGFRLNADRDIHRQIPPLLLRFTRMMLFGYAVTLDACTFQSAPSIPKGIGWTWRPSI